jgi:hypothetical protein
MSNIDDFFDAVLDAAKTVGGQAARDFLKQATTDSQAFKQQAEADLQTWTVSRANNEITQDEFDSLIRGQWAEAALAALLKAQVAAQDAAKLRDKIINIAISAAFKILL